jgi:FMN phosphatase YigB (HAD superfamily)
VFFASFVFKILGVFMPSNGIRAIFFDLDGTLRHNVPAGGDIFNAYLLTLGISLSEEERQRAMRWELLYWANSTDLLDDLKTFNGEDNKPFWIQYSRRRLTSLGIPDDRSVALASQVSLHMEESYNPASIIPNDVRNTLIALKESGYTLAVISNRDQPFHDVLESHGISEFFEFSLAGGEVDSFKPQPEIFHHALKCIAGLAAHETIYVGDNYYADVVGSRGAGLRPVLYDPNRLFPEADCAVIQSFDELISVIESN